MRQKNIIQKDNIKSTVVSKKLPKEVKSRILKNLLVAIMVVAYFLILILAHQNMRPERLAGDIEIFAIAYLVSGLIVLERAYKKDDGKLAITSIELLVLSFHTLSINHMVNILKSDFSTYLLISSGAFSIYFILKTIIIYTKDRKQYLNSLSDISEIVNEDKPIIKEATKKTKKVDDINNENDTKLQEKKDINKEENKLKDNKNKNDKPNKTVNKKVNSQKNKLKSTATATQKKKVIKDDDKKESEELNTKKAKTKSNKTSTKKNEKEPIKEVKGKQTNNKISEKSTNKKKTKNNTEKSETNIKNETNKKKTKNNTEKSETNIKNETNKNQKQLKNKKEVNKND